MNDKEFWMEVRHALLMFIGAIEKKLDISPRTSELRKHDGHSAASSYSGYVPMDKED